MAAPTSAKQACAVPDLSILIVSYNTKAMTVACLNSVQTETRRTRYEIIAVDNNSSDGSADAIAAHALQPKTFTRSDNLGFAGGNNLAARHAQGEYLLLLNPDTVVLDAAIDRLMDFARARPDAMIWGGRTLFADKTLNPSSCWHRMTPWNLLCRATGLTGLLPHTTLFNGEAMGGFDRTTAREVDIVSGCFLLLRRSLWERLGGFDPAFFMYGEEADLCLRARALGARPQVTPAATIIHYGGASEATRSSKMVKLLAAKMTLIDRHWPAWQAPFGRCLMLAWPLSRWLAAAAVAKLAGNSRWANTAATWGEIWSRRQEWGAGYTTKVTRSTAQPSTPH